MVAVGMLLVWVGYSLGLQGWCFLRDYDVTLGQLMSPMHPYAGPWPPAKIPDTQIWPGGTTTSGSGAPAGLAVPPIASSAALGNFASSAAGAITVKPNNAGAAPTQTGA